MDQNSFTTSTIGLRPMSRAVPIAAILALASAATLGVQLPANSPAGQSVSVAFPARPDAPTCSLQYATQDVFAGIFKEIPTPPGEPSPAQRLANLQPPYWRVNSTDDGGHIAMSLPSPVPRLSADGHEIAAWDFSHQAGLLSEAPLGTPKLLSITAPPDPLFTGTGVGQPGTLRDPTYKELAAYMANLVKYYNTGVLARGSGSGVIYGPNTLQDTNQDFSQFRDGSYGVTVDTVGTDGIVRWQTAHIVSVSSSHVVTVDSWSEGVPPSGSAYNLASTTPPMTSPAAATPWPPPPHAGPVQYWEIMNEPDLSNSFFPRSSPAVLPPTPRLAGIQAQQGRLVAGKTYAYRITALNIAGVESAGGQEVRITLGPGQNAVKLSWAATSNLGLMPYAYRIYGRFAGAEDGLVVVGRDAPGGLSWIDRGDVSPQGGVPRVDQGTAGFQLFRPHEYRRMWDVVVPAMKAADPSIKVVGPAVSNPTSLSPVDVNTSVVTTEPEDRSYLSHADFVQVLMAGTTNPPDVISFHSYGGWEGSRDGDARLFSEPDASAIPHFRRDIQPFAGSTPVWLTETNVEAGHFAPEDTRGLTQLDSAWLAHNFARWCQSAPQLQALFQYAFSNDNTYALVAGGKLPPGCAPASGCRMASGRPLLPYWTVTFLNRLIPPGSKILEGIRSPNGVEIMAVARPPDFATVEVLVINTLSGPTPGAGVPLELSLHLTGAESTGTRVWTLDADTDLVAGPSAQDLGPASDVRLDMGGYGVSFVEFRARSL